MSTGVREYYPKEVDTYFGMLMQKWREENPNRCRSLPKPDEMKMIMTAERPPCHRQPCTREVTSLWKLSKNDPICFLCRFHEPFSMLIDSDNN